MTSDELQAVEVATQTFHKYPNYAQKLIHKFPAPLVERSSVETGPGDLHGIWYECLYEVAVKHPDKALIEKLYIVCAYRKFVDFLRSKNGKRKQGPHEWVGSNPDRMQEWMYQCDDDLAWNALEAEFSI